ncbi:hypothetical protein HMPREF1592_01470, partial [Escherichia coli 907357]
TRWPVFVDHFKSTPALAIALALNVRINSHPSVLPLVIFQGKIKTT